MDLLALVAGWVIVAFMAVLGAVIIFKMLNGTIDLAFLVSEDDGKASLSRLQFLIFTFVIATGLLLIILAKGEFPAVGNDVFVLLGISAGSYVGSKIAQKAAASKEEKARAAAPQAQASANPAPNPAANG